MANPKGNPGNKGGGRKGYEWETAEFKRLTTMFRGVLTIAEKIRLGKATPADLRAYDKLEKPFLKMMDKMFASKSDVKIDIPKPILIKNE